jgi:hypothetical protein
MQIKNSAQVYLGFCAAIPVRVADPDPHAHYFRKLDSNPH